MTNISVPNNGLVYRGFMFNEFYLSHYRTAEFHMRFYAGIYLYCIEESDLILDIKNEFLYNYLHPNKLNNLINFIIFN